MISRRPSRSGRVEPLPRRPEEPERGEGALLAQKAGTDRHAETTARAERRERILSVAPRRRAREFAGNQDARGATTEAEERCSHAAGEQRGVQLVQAAGRERRQLTRAKAEEEDASAPSGHRGGRRKRLWPRGGRCHRLVDRLDRRDNSLLHRIQRGARLAPRPLSMVAGNWPTRMPGLSAGW